MIQEHEVTENKALDVIKPINRDTVHRICSGQVVLSLAIAVKELVENAIDAGATNIEIRLKEYGNDLVEVVDNGVGVPKENFQALTLKHYTSKLRQFSDLESVETLGFRGEALSSLCALSDLTVTTRHGTAQHGTKIQYDNNGKIVSESPTARSYGTTVTLSNLFATLPVRRKEFAKNLKREFNKMCQLLYAYCLVCTGVKLTCSNQTCKGTKTTVVSTQGLSSVRDNIISVFGSKQISSLIDINTVEPDDSILQEYGLKMIPGEKVPFEFECFISSVMHCSGRSSTDRQFYFINSRPCELSKVIKLVNEVYRQFNGSQYPFVYLNVLTEKQHVDVNVTPDKRQIFLQKENLLLATIKASLLDAFKSFPSTYKLQNLNNGNVSNGSVTSLKRSLSETTKKVGFFESFKKKTKVDMDGIETCVDTKAEIKTMPNIKCTGSGLMSAYVKVGSVSEEINLAANINKSVETVNELTKKSEEEMILDSTALTVLEKEENFTTQIQDISSETVTVTCKLSKETDADMIVDTKILKVEQVENKRKQKPDLQDTARHQLQDRTNKDVVTVSASVDQIKELLKKCRSSKSEDAACVRFRSEISPNANKQAERELQKQITKENFKQMEIVGQFNLGFIIARLENDLFIIDQHATDEKYNFEQLQFNTVLESQVLVSPKPLELTAGNESLLIDNVDIFNKNGFTFSIDHSAEATKKVKLTSIPVSKNVIFGKDDIDELLFMLQDASHTMCRPSRVRTMFASRACRKSVMIGHALTHSDMKKLVEHMSEIDQPWNCPHGRPTMRHLINLNLIHKE